MEVVMNGTTPDHGKWISVNSFLKAYNKLAVYFNSISANVKASTYSEENLASPHSLTWIEQKNRFDTVFTNVLALEATLSVIAPVYQTQALPVEDLIQAHLRQIVFEKPQRETEIQNAVDSLLVGRGYTRGSDYIREGNKLYFSGKEFIPDFAFPGLSLSVEVKLVKERSGISSAVEEMSADIPAYTSKYARLVFVVYDLGFIRDIIEFSSGLEAHPSVRVLVVKH